VSPYLIFIVHTYSLLGILVKQPQQQVFRLRGYVLRNLQLRILDILIEFLYVFSVMRRETD
jgi:hypothetical protein